MHSFDDKGVGGVNKSLICQVTMRHGEDLSLLIYFVHILLLVRNFGPRMLQKRLLFVRNFGARVLHVITSRHTLLSDSRWLLFLLFLFFIFASK